MKEIAIFFLKIFGMIYRMEDDSWEINPILYSELRKVVRKKKFFIILSFYVLILAIIILFVYKPTANNPQSYTYLGKTIFWVSIIVQGGALYFISAAYSSSAIVKEKEMGTFEGLMLTDLHPKDIFSGKLYAAIFPSLMFLVSSLPIIMLTILWGGVPIYMILIGFFVVVLITIINGVIGVSYSILFNSSKKSKTATYLTLIIPYVNALLFFISIILGIISVNRLKNYSGVHERTFKRN